jgi:predicted  nucleic acid-binding Zn-ribbon protein
VKITTIAKRIDRLEDELGLVMNRIFWSDDQNEVKRLQKRHNVLYDKVEALRELWDVEMNRMIDEGISF